MNVLESLFGSSVFLAHPEWKPVVEAVQARAQKCYSVGLSSVPCTPEEYHVLWLYTRMMAPLTCTYAADGVPYAYGLPLRVGPVEEYRWDNRTQSMVRK